MQQLLPLFLALQHRQYQSGLAGLFISCPPFPRLFERASGKRLKGNTGMTETRCPTQEPSASSCCAVCSEGRQVPADKHRLSYPTASREGDSLTFKIHSVFLKGVCMARFPGSRVRLWEFGPGPHLTNPNPEKGTFAQQLLWTWGNDPD